MNSESSLNMEKHQNFSQPKTAKLGWGILLSVNTLLIIDGATWFFIGPNIIHARLVAVWYISFGLLALLVALEGYRNGSRWAWYASWVPVGALAALGAVELIMDAESFFGLILLGASGITVAGLLLARKGLA